MNYKEIANMPTSLDRDEISNGASGWHESLLRSLSHCKESALAVRANGPLGDCEKCKPTEV